MKKVYSQILLIFGLLFLVEISFSQNSLDNSNYGSQIQTYLNSNKEKFNLIDSDIEDLYVSDEYFSKSTEITHVYVTQRYQGIQIHNAVSSIAIKDEGVFHYANNFINDINSKINTISPVLIAEQAILNTANYFNLGEIQNLNLISGNDKEFTYSNGNISQVNIPVKLVFIQTADGNLKLAWDLSIHTTDSKNWWSVRIDAVSGEVLDTNDWILSCNFENDNHLNHSNHNISIEENSFNLFKKNSSFLVDGSQYNVFALPTESPIHGPRTLLSEPADIIASPYGWHDTNGEVGPEYTITRGNNVWAQEDRNANNGVGYSPDGTVSLNFDFPLNLNQSPALYEDAAITNLFYLNNVMHDIWYQYGFNEESGNFQSSNYGNGGSGSDFVVADAQDGSSINNAVFGTPPDGNNPRMSMFLWSAVGPAGDPLTINNGSLAGDYFGLPANFGGILSPTPITADLALVVDSNFGVSTDPNDACDIIINGSSLIGKIAVIRRGLCEFGFKILAAENEGAIAVIMVNDVATPIVIEMPEGADGSQVTIPSVMISQADGEALISALSGGETINGSILDPGPYERDGDLDNSIVTHEYGHGISNRLAGGPSQAGCLQNAEQMGEGWSDWFALMLTMNVGDVSETPRGMSTYAIAQGVNGGGLRNAPYTTDFAVNSFTYGNTNNTSNISQPHGIGFVWATMLWDLTWAYIDKYGFDPDLYNGTGGNNKVMQIVIDGLKLQPCSPGFVDGRDAILAADTALTGGEDQCLIWETFAARGLGFFANQGDEFVRTDQVEAFNLPADNDPSLANCTSLSVDEFNTNDYKVYPNPTSDLLYIKTSKSFGEVVITLTDLNGRLVFSKKANLFDIVELEINQLQSGLYILNIKGQNIDANEKIIKK